MSEICKNANRPGLWTNEPDFIEWEDKETGLKCQIIRQRTGGNLCGYVGVNKDSKIHGLDYHCPIFVEDLETGQGLYRDGVTQAINVHGGITFSGRFNGDDKTWWFGFDCSHYGDYVPIRPRDWVSGGVYRDWDYVKDEVESLARQILQIQNSVVYKIEFQELGVKIKGDNK